jgi:CII-binding regulator of phage lambda lysogenization HflD
MKFVNLSRAQRVHTFNRIKQLRGNLAEYRYAVSNLKNRLEAAEYQVNKTDRELAKMLSSFEDADKIGQSLTP